MAMLAQNCDKFVALLRKSHLLSEEQLTVALDSENPPDDPKALATRLVREGYLTQFQAQNLLNGRYRHFIVGKYKVLEPIGAGGMSRVYLGEHTTMGHRVALKILPADRMKDPTLVERFHREARAIAALNHPNVVRAHDIDKEGDRFYYIVMDYVEGVNLDDLVRKRGPLDPVRAAHYMAQAADGLQHIYEASMVHRDIKPGNLLLDHTGVVKILDLGLARFQLDVRDNLTGRYDENVILGTADFLSPEQALKSSEVDIRADIYSLGATFYFLLAGQAPFDAETVTQKLLAVQLREPTPLASLRPDLPPALVAVVETMMAKNPDNRYSTPEEVAEALDPWTQNPIPPPHPQDLRCPAASPHRTPVPSSGAQVRHPTPGAGAASTLRQSKATGRRKSPSTARTRLASALPIWKRPRILAAGGAVLALGMILVVWRPWRSASAKPDRADNSAAANVLPPVPANLPPPPAGSLVVAASGAEPRFPTVAAALAAAKPGQRTVILIRNPVHQEQLSLSGAKAANVAIESGIPGTAVTWMPPPGAADKPLLDLNGVEGFRVKGVRFDGKQRTTDLVRVSGRCPDLTLAEVHVTGFTRSGVTFSGCTGLESRPITVQRLYASGGAEGSSGVLFDRGVANQHVRLLESRFDGPMAAGVTVSGPLTGLEVRRNRFFRLQQGVHYRPAGPPTSFAAQIRNNTFAEVNVGIEFAVSPPVASAGEVAVIDNLFAQTGHLAQLTAVPLMPEGPSPPWVWFPEFEAAKPQVPPQPRYFRKTFTLSARPANPVVLNIGCDESFTVWVNGKEVGKSTHAHFSQRVYAFDMTGALAAGPNVIAVEGANELDPFFKTFGTAAALTVELTEADPTRRRVLLTTDETWKASRTKSEGWERPGFDDADWAFARVWNIGGLLLPWRETVWDSVVEPHLRGQNRPIRLVVAGNVRDYASVEGYPVLESKRTAVKVKDDSVIGLDPADDAKFLRYAPGSPLSSGGTQQGPVGAPPPGL